MKKNVVSVDGTSPSRIPVAPVHGVKQRHVVEAITEAIVRRRFRPGQRLVEAELTEAMGVSRSVIREALREMAAQNLIDLIPNRGAVVARLSRRKAIDLLEIRAELDALAAARAARAMDQPGIRERFSAALSGLDMNGVRGDVEAYVLENSLFHRAITAAGGNVELQRVADGLRLSLMMGQIGHALTLPMLVRSVKEHALIAEAILDGEARAAAANARAHIEATADLIRSLPSELF